MTKRATVWTMAVVGLWCLACSGEVTVNDEVVDAADPVDVEEPEEGGEAEEDGEDEGSDEAGDDVGKKELVQAIKALDVKLGKLDASCNEHMSPAEKKAPVNKWIAKTRKSASKSKVECEGSDCKLQIWIDDGSYVELALPMKDGAIDPADIRCTWAG